MRRQILTIMALAGVVMLAGCKKQGIETVPSGEGAVVFTATTGGGGEKTLLYPSENGAVKWESGDAIKVNNGNYVLSSGAGTTSGTFTLNTGIAPSAPYCAVYPNANGNSVSGSTVTLTLPATQQLVAGSFGSGANPMVAYSSTTSLDFKNVCGALRIKLYGEESNTRINRIVLSTSSGRLCGTYTVDANSSTPTLNYASGEGTTLTLSGDLVTLSTDSSNPTEFYAVLPPGDYTASNITVTAYYDYVPVYTGTMLDVDFTIERSAVTVAQTSACAINTSSCLFSIGSGTQVYFSKSNLVRESSSGKFYLADNQYYYDGTASTYPSTYLNWSTACGMASQTIYDSDGSTSYGTGWRILTNTEWNYLTGRTVNGTTGDGGAYRRVTLTDSKDGKASVYGMIIFPDSYTGTVPDNGESITKATFESTYETAGCVFLPAAGYSNDSSVNGAGSYGNYWTSVLNFGYNAFYWSFTSAGIGTNSSRNVACGLSVRLVSFNE